MKLGVVLLLAFALCGCANDGPGRPEIIDKIKSDPGMAGSPDATVECVADWYMTYASSEDRAKFVSGELGDRGVDQVAGTEEAKTAILDCLKGVAENR